MPLCARAHHAKRDGARLTQSAQAIDEPEQAAAVAGQVEDETGRVLQRAHRRAELLKHRRGEQVEAHVTDAAAQARRLELDELRRERLEEWHQLSLQTLARNDAAEHVVSSVGASGR